MTLLDDDTLAGSAVVANSAMNPSAPLPGSTATTVSWASTRSTCSAAGSVTGAPDTVAWLDLCCGTGRALVEAARRLTQGVGAAVPGPGRRSRRRLRPGPDRLAAADRGVGGGLEARAAVRPHHQRARPALRRRQARPADEGGGLADRRRPARRRHRPRQRPARGRPARRSPPRRAPAGRGFNYDGRRRRIGRDDRGEVALPYEYLAPTTRRAPTTPASPRWTPTTARVS